jgi:ribokinase
VISPRPRVAVVGHIEWATHAAGTFPGPGEIRSLHNAFDEPAGGGAVAAAQAAKLGAATTFITALGADAVAAAAAAQLTALGIELRVARRDVPQTRAISVTGPLGDRAIALIGDPMGPEAADDLGWDDLAAMDAVYFTGRDPATLAACRSARFLVVAARRWQVLAAAGIGCDVLIASGNDADETVPAGALPIAPAAWVITDGARGGTYLADGAPPRTWEAARPPGPEIDSYGCGDAFAAGLTVGLARGWDLAGAVALGARCGAATITARGGLAGQLTEADET